MRKKKPDSEPAEPERLWCCRCYEEFPIGSSNEPIRMGLLFPISRFAKAFRTRLDGDYLCGNCYFDLTEE